MLLTFASLVLERWPRRLALTALVGLSVGGCASTHAHPASAGQHGPDAFASEQARQWMSEHQRVVAIHRSKCGACHTPVEPGSTPRAEVAAALQRHRPRAKLTEQEWADMVEYLSSDGALFPRRSASLP